MVSPVTFYEQFMVNASLRTDTSSQMFKAPKFNRGFVAPQPNAVSRPRRKGAPPIPCLTISQADKAPAI
jgi:hypothetical protein